MVNRRISPDLKECALTLWEKGWEMMDIVDVLSVSRASIYRWQAIFEEFGSVNRPPSPLRGRCRILTRAILTAIHELHHDDPDLYLDELALWLAIHHDTIISISALQRNLEETGLSRKVMQKIAQERDEELREEWRELLRSEAFSGDGSEFDVFVRGDRYSLLPAMTTEGYIAARVVPGSFDSMEFYDFVAEEVLPQMNPYPAERSVLVLDNCRIHHNDALVDLV
ncbi:hypothetical protein BDZ97DRAFT_1612960, partial [Flammula alnicola]